MSADTMMNGWKNPSHKKEVVFLPDISQPEDRDHFVALLDVVWSVPCGLANVVMNTIIHLWVLLLLIWHNLMLGVYALPGVY